jgi:threonine aldolase
MAGGTVYPLDVLQSIYSGARDAGLAVHMDGARIFNAAVHLDVPVAWIANYADTVMFCLSKGLGSPASGSAGACGRPECLRPRV